MARPPPPRRDRRRPRSDDRSGPDRPGPGRANPVLRRRGPGERACSRIIETPAGETKTMSLLEQSRPEPDAATAVAAARDYLFSIQREDGHWCGELEGATILESEYVLTNHFQGRTGEKTRKAAAWIRGRQLPEGGWAIYPGGPAEVSASVKAYFALKLEGDDAEAPHMKKARRVILGLGGLEACNSFTKIYLAIFGQYDWKRCPAVPPALV